MEMDNERKRELEWNEAQNIEISLNLLAAAQQQLQFLAAVDRKRCLYEGPVLQKAIYRYNCCWLPMLAKHVESPIFDGPLVVPLDCEWVWHCHRLNPIRYKTDCEELFGRILDNCNVLSSVKGTCKRQTKEIWNRLYPDEPYDFDFDFESNISGSSGINHLAAKHTEYDLVSAVKRQSSFFYQVSAPHMKNDIFLEEAVARYKGFLHIIKRNRERSISRFCVPTYDIDLIWHTHQLHPLSYSKDVTRALGRILEHDDMDSDRTKGKKLDVGFSGTTEHWEEMFGRRYWKSGAMYRGNSPPPVTMTPIIPNDLSKPILSNDFQKMVQLPEVKTVQIYLEIVGVKNLPEGLKGNLFVMFSKEQPDLFFDIKRKLTILSESGEKQVAIFQCEPKGELLFELVLHSPSAIPISKPFQIMGTALVSLEEFLNPVSRLSTENWVELIPVSGKLNSNPICLRIALSFTPPSRAPPVLHMVHSHPLSKLSCFFPLPGVVHNVKSWTHMIHEGQGDILSLQMRDSTNPRSKGKDTFKKHVVGVSESNESHTLAEFIGTGWSIMDGQWFLQFKKHNEEEHLFDLVGSMMVKIFQGRKLLENFPQYDEKRSSEQDFMTAVEFSSDNPYGKALALIDLKHKFVKVEDERFLLPGITAAYIITYVLKKKGYYAF